MGIKSTVSRAKPELQKIRDYQLITQLTNKNSGNGLWAFAVKDGREYFIKQFLSPVCPREGCGIPADIIARKRKEGDKFYQKMTRLYYAVNKSATGNIVTIDAFFFEDTKYYITTQRIDTANLEMKQIASRDNDVKVVLMKVIAHSLASLHANGVVHADLKPSNVLIKETTVGTGKSKSLTAKLIDFDSSYLEREREKDDRVEGDVVYLAPETLLADQGEDVKLSTKVDVFALGLLFHQYYTGDLPRFSTEYSYAHEAVLDGRTLFLDTRLPGDLKSLIASMLDRHPEKRPTTQEVFETLQGKRETTGHLVSEREVVTKLKDEHDTSSVWHKPRSLS